MIENFEKLSANEKIKILGSKVKAKKEKSEQLKSERRKFFSRFLTLAEKEKLPKFMKDIVFEFEDSGKISEKQLRMIRNHVVGSKKEYWVLDHQEIFLNLLGFKSIVRKQITLEDLETYKAIVDRFMAMTKISEVDLWHVKAINRKYHHHTSSSPTSKTIKLDILKTIMRAQKALNFTT